MNFEAHTEPCFAAIMEFAEPSAGAVADARRARHVYTRVCGHIDALLGAVGPGGANMGRTQHGDGPQIAYAIAALADEMALGAAPAIADFWSDRSLLQVRYFDEHAAGDHFFDRVARLCHTPSSQAVLAAYHTALVLGFAGRYAGQAGVRRLHEVMTDLRARLDDAAAATPAALHITCDGVCAPEAAGRAPGAENGWAWWTPARGWRTFWLGLVALGVCYAVSSWHLWRLTRPVFALAAPGGVPGDGHAALGP